MIKVLLPFVYAHMCTSIQEIFLVLSLSCTSSHNSPILAVSTHHFYFYPLLSQTTHYHSLAYNLRVKENIRTNWFLWRNLEGEEDRVKLLAQNFLSIRLRWLLTSISKQFEFFPVLWRDEPAKMGYFPWVRGYILRRHSFNVAQRTPVSAAPHLVIFWHLTV